jgi:hypothetical protein
MDENDFAAIEYHGIAGATADCLKAVERLLHYGARIKQAMILAYGDENNRSHGLILTTETGDKIAIKAGFRSGYGGTSPKGFSSLLGLLHWHKIDIEEIEVDKTVLARLDQSALTVVDLDNIESSKTIRPRRLWDYIFEKDAPNIKAKNPWSSRRTVLPFSIIDPRIADLALQFWDDPDGVLLKIHRRLETIIRDRISHLKDNEEVTGSRLFSAAFNGDKPPLAWPNVGMSECKGRANLFIGISSAYRNPRAHREASGNSQDQLSEFLLVNHLYRLESEAQLEPPPQ